MKKQPKKKFDIPTQANTKGEISIQHGNLDTQGSFEGDSVDEHNDLEYANSYLAEKEISQTFNNS